MYLYVYHSFLAYFYRLFDYGKGGEVFSLGEWRILFSHVRGSLNTSKFISFLSLLPPLGDMCCYYKKVEEYKSIGFQVLKVIQGVQSCNQLIGCLVLMMKTTDNYRR